jgi:hypothetical protein
MRRIILVIADDDEFHNKYPAHAVPLASARQHSEKVASYLGFG